MPVRHRTRVRRARRVIHRCVPLPRPRLPPPASPGGLEKPTTSPRWLMAVGVCQLVPPRVGSSVGLPFLSHMTGCCALKRPTATSHSPDPARILELLVLRQHRGAEDLGELQESRPGAPGGRPPRRCRPCRLRAAAVGSSVEVRTPVRRRQLRLAAPCGERRASLVTAVREPVPGTLPDATARARASPRAKPNKTARPREVGGGVRGSVRHSDDFSVRCSTN